MVLGVEPSTEHISNQLSKMKKKSDAINLTLLFIICRISLRIRSHRKPNVFQFKKLWAV